MNTEIKGYGGRSVLKADLNDYRPSGSKIKSGIFSRMDIKNHIEKFGVDLSCCKAQNASDYENFSDYISRSFNENARPIDSRENSLICPCDGYLTAHFINSFSMIPLDGYMYSIEKFLGGDSQFKEFAEGMALVVRLTEADPHRFIYFDNGVNCESKFISADKNMENIMFFGPRNYSLLKTDNFYTVAQIEVCSHSRGIEQFNGTDSMAFFKGQEKGRFLCSGAAVVLLFKKGVMHPDDEFMVNTGMCKETRVHMGEKIGVAISR